MRPEEGPGIDLSVVLPTLNEKENVEILLPRIHDTLRAMGVHSEIWIVDDGSTDGTVEAAEGIAESLPEIRTLRRMRPPGLADSLREGFGRASGRHVACMDADLCHDPAYLRPMWERMEACDLVIGSRYLDSRRTRTEGKTFLQDKASRWGRRVTSGVLGLPQSDTSHSFRMFRRSCYERIAPGLRSHGNLFFIEFLCAFQRSGFRIEEIPVAYGVRRYGESKLNVLGESLRYLVHLPALRMRYRERKATG